MNTIDTLRQQLADRGVYPSHVAYQRAMEQAEAEATKAVKKDGGIVRNPQIAASIQAGLGWVSEWFTKIVLVGGTGLVLVAFGLAEGVAIRDGMLAFGTHDIVATVSTVAVVCGLYVSLFVYNMVRDNNDQYQNKQRFTLAAVKRWWRVFVGREQPQQKDGEDILFESIKASVRLTEAAIVTLSFFGRSAVFMLANEDSSWYQFLTRDLLISGSAVDFMGSVTTALVTYALLRMTETVSYFIYTVFTAQAGKIETKADDTKKAQALATAQEQALQNLLLEVESRQNKKRAEQQQQSAPAENATPS